jgi:hypothetical protein
MKKLAAVAAAVLFALAACGGESKSTTEGWTAAQERKFSPAGAAGTNARLRCILRGTEKEWATFAAWKAATEESGPDGLNTPGFLAKVDRIEREINRR